MSCVNVNVSVCVCVCVRVRCLLVARCSSKVLKCGALRSFRVVSAGIWFAIAEGKEAKRPRDGSLALSLVTCAMAE